MKELKESAEIIKADIKHLQNKLKKVLLNIHTSGASYESVSIAIQYINGELLEPEKETTEEDLKALVNVLVKMSHFSKVVIEESLIPGDLVEESYESLALCKHVLDKWVEKEDGK